MQFSNELEKVVKEVPDGFVVEDPAASNAFKEVNGPDVARILPSPFRTIYLIIWYLLVSREGIVFLQK